MAHLSSPYCQGQCEYVLVKDCTGSNQFQVNVRNVGSSVTVTRAVAIRIASVGVIVMKQGQPTRINDIEIPGYPYTLPADGSRITKVGGRIRVFLANSGVVVYWDGSHFVQVTVPPHYFDSTCGLCGQYNGDRVDDLEAKNGTVYYPSHPTYSSSQASRHAYHAFGISWAVTGNDRMLLDTSDSCKDPTVEPNPPCFGKPAVKAAAEKYCYWIKDPDGPYVDCHPVRDPEEAFSSCVFDVCGNDGDTSVACDVVQSYETLCRRLGVTSIGSVIDRCGVCFGDGSTCRGGVTCQASGDPHYTTFDGLGHHFQGRCEYVLAQDCREQDFVIHVENNQRGRTDVSWTKAVAVSIKNVGVIRLLPNKVVTVNSRVVETFPYRLPGDGTVVSRTSRHVEVDIVSFDVVVTFDGVHLVEVSVPDDYKYRTCGLCGIYDGDPWNDLSLKNGTVLKPSHKTYSSSSSSIRAYHVFGVSWEVQGADRLLLGANDSCSDSTTPPSPPCNGKTQIESDARRYCGIIADTQGPYAACHSSIDPAMLVESCVFDICACNGDNSCGCDAIRAYEATCRRLGVAQLGTVVDACGVCFGDGSSCSLPPASCQAYGDPHYSTFDNAGHHFQGQCEYILTMDCTHKDFTVHVRNEHRYGNSHVTYTRSVAIKVPGVAIIKLLPSKRTLVNNFEVMRYPHVIGVDGSLIQVLGGLVKVSLASSGVEVVWNGNDFVKVIVPGDYRDRVCGLCGTFDGDAQNDLELRNGTVLHASHLTNSRSDQSSRVYNDFGRDWAVPAAERVLLDRNVSCVDPAIPPPHPCDAQAGLRALAEKRCRVILDQQGPYAPCHTAVDPQVQFESCVFDSCACGGGTSCTCEAVYAYEDSCRERGVKDLGSVIDECGVCFGDGSSCPPRGSVCQASGDPHYSTLDGAGHHFQGKCEYVLVKDCGNNDFAVHVRNEYRGSQTLTWTKSVAIRVTGGPVIKLLRNSVVQVSGREVTSFPRTLSPDDTVLRKVGRVVIVRLGSSGVRVTWDGDSIVQATIPPEYENKTCGLCGQYDGSWENDLQLANGTVVHPSHRYASSSLKSLYAYHVFGVSWAVNNNSRLLLFPSDFCVDDTIPPPHPCDSKPSSVRSAAEKYCNVIRDPQGPYSVCHGYIDPVQAYESCVFDTCGCDGNTDCSCRSVRAYETRCRDLKVNDVGTVVDECGVCFGDGSSCISVGCTAQASGDPHYLTCDGSGHHFQGKCEYVFVKDLENDDFQVHVHNEHRGSQVVTWTRDVAVKSRGGAVIHILKGRTVKVNGETVSSFPYYVAVDGTWIRRVGNKIRVFLANSGVTVAFDGHHFLEVTVPDEYRGRIGGLAGNFNGNFSDDLEARDGTIYRPSNRYYSNSLPSRTAYNLFGISWAVNGTNRLILSPNDPCIDPVIPLPGPCDPYPALKRQAEDYCRFITDRHGAYGSCHDVVPPELYFQSCVVDSCACQGAIETCACASVRAYEAACGRNNVTDLGSVIDECGVCFGDGTSCEPNSATCQASGDPHYTTFDNSGHHFQGRCEYVLAKDCSNDSKWEIYVRNEHRGNRLVTYTRSVAIRISGVGVVKLLQGQAVEVTGRPVTRFPYTIPGDGSVIRKQFGSLKVYLANADVVVRFDGRHLVQVSVPPEYHGRLCGLCGSYNGDFTDDLQLRNGSIVYPSHRFNSGSTQSRWAYQTFGVSWTVPTSQRLLIPTAETCIDDSTPPPHPCDGNPALRSKAEQRCRVITNVHGPYRACHGVADEGNGFESCVFDACACGDRPECYCGAVLAYEEMCKRRGVQNIGTVIDECGVCFGDGSSCSPGVFCQATGDPHYTTFDGLGHHFQGRCEYVLAKDCGGTDFNIHVKNERISSSSRVTVTRDVAIKVRGMGVIQLLRNNIVIVSGKQVTDYPYYVGSHAIITRQPPRWILVRLSESRVQVRFDGYHTVQVAVPDDYFNDTCGLCGFYNGVALDDLKTVNGTVLMASNPHASGSQVSIYAYHAFGITWAVNGVNRLLLDAGDLCADDVIPPPHPCDGQAQLRTQAQRYCAFISDPRGPYGKCHGVINPTNHYESCVFDTCACGGDTNCACDAVAAYETLCLHSNVTNLGSVVDECGVCFGDGTSCTNPGATCQVAGGPHYATFDKAGYRFEGYCEYVLVENADFSIHVQNGPCCQQEDATVKNCAISISRVGVVQLNEDQTVLVNGFRVDNFPYTIAADGSRIAIVNGRIRVWLANSEAIVLWDGRNAFLQIDVPVSYINNTQGLCGTYNNDPSDDLTLRNGSVVIPSNIRGSQSRQSRWAYYDFGVSWSVNGTDRLLLDSIDQCVDPAPKDNPCVDNAASKPKAEQYCHFIINTKGPFAACHSTVDPHIYYQACLSETCRCKGDTSCACRAITSYETVCRTKGIQQLGTVVDECGVCFGDGSTCLKIGATCQASGDPHYVTFDGLGHHFQGKCEYILAQDCQAGDFKIHVRNIGDSVTVTRAVAVDIRGVGSLRLLQGLAVEMNGINVAHFPYVVPGDGSRVTKIGRSVRVHLASSGVVIFWDGSHTVQVTVPPDYRNRTCGLCGQFNDIMMDDLETRNGTVYTPSNPSYSSSTRSTSAYHAFGVSWAVPQSDWLIIDPSVTCTDPVLPPPHPCDDKPIIRQQAEKYCSIIKSLQGPYGNCHNVIPPANHYESCVFDTCQCDGCEESACDSVRSYELLCKARGVTDIGSVLDECDVCFGDGSQCENIGATCLAAGDPHYTTFDGAGHHFQGRCEYILAEDCTANRAFSVHVRNEHQGNAAVTWTKSVAVVAPGLGYLLLLSNGVVIHSGIQVTTFPRTTPDGTRISKKPGNTRVRLAGSDVIVTWDGNHMVQVSVPSEYNGKTCGLCGPFDYNYVNDLQLKNGTVVHPSHKSYSSSSQSVYAYHVFGTSWAVPANQSLLLDDGEVCVDDSVVPPGPCDGKPQIRSKAEQYCNFIRDVQGPYTACHSTVDPSKEFNECVFDVCSCGGTESCACGAVCSYETLCANQGVKDLGSVIDECGVCFGDGSTCERGVTCQALGDPHYYTFDGAAHHFQGQCEYTLVSDCVSGDFSVHVRNEHRGSPYVTWTRSVAIRVKGASVIKLLQNSQVYVSDRQVTRFTYIDGVDGTRISRQGAKIRVWLANSGVIVRWDERHLVEVTMPDAYKDKTCGLCGTYDGDYANDLEGSDGTVYQPSDRYYSSSDLSQTVYHAFGRSWTVLGDKRLLLEVNDSCVDPLTHPRNPCSVNPQVRASAEEYCSFITQPQGLYAACQRPFNDTLPPLNANLFYESCIFDTCAAQGDNSVACNSVRAYESECRRRGADIGSVVDRCGVCFGDGSSCAASQATCSASGDPHYVTFDGAGHHFQGECEYVLAKDCINGDFTVHVRNEHRYGNSRVTYTRSVAVRARGLGVVKILAGRKVLFGGQVITDSKRTLPDQSQLTITSNSVSLALASGVEITFDGSHFVQVTVTGEYLNRMCGLCGNYDNQWMNDLELSDGRVMMASSRRYSSSAQSLKAYHDFGVSYAVTGNDRLLLNPNETCQDSSTPPSHPCDGTNYRTSAEQFCKIITDTDGPYYVGCKDIVDLFEAVESCVFDVCACAGNSSCGCDIVKVFESECRRLGGQGIGTIVDVCGVCNGDGTSCLADYGRCFASGDPHYSTFDGYWHHFQGRCEYVFAQDCVGGDLSIHVENENRHGNSLVSYTKAVAINAKVLGILKLLKNGVELNGRSVDIFPHRVGSDGTTIDKQFNEINVKLGLSGVLVQWSGANSYIKVSVPPTYEKRMCGLCGTFDGNSTNDLRLRDGSEVLASSSYFSSSQKSRDAYHSFGTSWTVPTASRLLLTTTNVCTDDTTAPTHPCDVGNLRLPDQRRKQAEQKCQDIVDANGPYGVCHGVVNTTSYFESCIYDVCACDLDSDCACSSVVSYEEECRRRGVININSIVDNCGVCHGDGSSCRRSYAQCNVFSDPHSAVAGSTQQTYFTFDSLLHRFQGKCEYVLARDCTGLLFDIHIENDSPSSTVIHTAWTTGVAVRVAGLGLIKVIHTAVETKAYLNGNPLPRPSNNRGIDGSQVKVSSSDEDEDTVEIFLASSDVKITLFGNYKTLVSVPPSFKSRLCGLCGNYNGKAADDLTLPTGVSLNVSNVNGSTSQLSVSNYHAFGTSWAVDGDDRLILAANDSCQDPNIVPWCARRVENKRKVENFCDVINAIDGPFVACHNATSPDSLYHQCVLDACSHNGSLAFGCSAIRSYQSQCERQLLKTLGPTVLECSHGRSFFKCIRCFYKECLLSRRLW